MLPILLYLLKANVALLLFAAAYFGLLRRLTFFTLNRATWCSRCCLRPDTRPCPCRRCCRPRPLPP